jgi:hypothetical protein
MKQWMVAAVAGVAVCLVASCGSKLPEASSSTAERFYQAVEQRDGAAACALLAPATRDEVAADAPCATAILDEDLPPGGSVTELRQYGTEAQARMRGDTAFLAEFDDGWKVVAAGCTSKGRLPYDCKVKG